MLRSRLTTDALAGGLFLLTGLGALLVAGDYPVGDAARMGPGYFPQLLGGALVLLGLLVLLLSWRSQPSVANSKLLWAWLAVPMFWGLLAGFGHLGLTGLDLALIALLALACLVSRPLFWVSASVALFALLLEPLGLGMASLVLMLAARRAEPELSWRGAFAAWLVLLLVCLAIFVWGLGTPLPVWPRFMVT